MTNVKCQCCQVVVAIEIDRVAFGLITKEGIRTTEQINQLR